MTSFLKLTREQILKGSDADFGRWEAEAKQADQERWDEQVRFAEKRRELEKLARATWAALP